MLCGEGGERSRKVTCVLINNGTIVEETHCTQSTKPESIASCGDECQYEWRRGEWGACDGDSCEDGIRRRDVNCVLVNNGSAVAESYCNSSGERPATQTDCQAHLCQYDWRTGAWGRCSVGCGEGVREREVYCVLVNGRDGERRVESIFCDNSSLPKRRETCVEEPCTNYNWTSSPWTEVCIIIHNYISDTVSMLGY